MRDVRVFAAARPVSRAKPKLPCSYITPTPPQAGLIISGINAEVMPGQWEFQIGPTGPLETGDQVRGGGDQCCSSISGACELAWQIASLGLPATWMQGQQVQRYGRRGGGHAPMRDAPPFPPPARRS